jgi:hypothetical protein
MLFRNPAAGPKTLRGPGSGFFAHTQRLSHGNFDSTRGSICRRRKKRPDFRVRLRTNATRPDRLQPVWPPLPGA